MTLKLQIWSCSSDQMTDASIKKLVEAGCQKSEIHTDIHGNTNMKIYCRNQTRLLSISWQVILLAS